MALRIPRRASRIDPRSGSNDSRPLEQWRSLDAYVLLGDPGAGKSWAFEDERHASEGLLLTARNVVAGITPADMAGRTVFIDGLDEVRAGAAHGSAPFDAIRKWLHDQGRPRFRLSCREADWRGGLDQSRLQDVAPHGEVNVLHLDPLTDEDIKALLASRREEVPDPGAFLTAIELAGLEGLLCNPLLLDLMIRAEAVGSLPRTRSGIYEAAARQLAREHNDEHQLAKPIAAGDVDRVLDDAGLLCALLLLSGQRGIAEQHGEHADAVTLPDLPLGLTWHDPAAALRSKVFAADAGLAVPRHRSIAEFLAARALARLIQAGLPLGRVMALMQGTDGRPVDPLRGLWAWLAVHHAPGRAQLIAADPLGFVLNGDAAALSPGERLALLHALRDAAEQDPWFRKDSWVSHPFGPLATADMAATYEALLRDPRRDRGHLSFVDCLFDALQHGEPMPSLAPALEAWIEDGTLPSELRKSAYAAWKRCTGFAASKALAWLQGITDGSLPDDEDRLYGALLQDLYPTHLPPERVFDHWRASKGLSSGHWTFWHHTFWQLSPPDVFATLANSWVSRQQSLSGQEKEQHDIFELSSRLLAAALEHAGDQASDAQLYDWLGMCLDEYGASRLEDKPQAVSAWLAERPQRMKAVMAIGLSKAQPDEDGRWHLWSTESRLHGATRPRDWLFWLLDQAAATTAAEVAEYCFFPAARAAIQPVVGLDAPTMEQVEAWVASQRGRWPQAAQWLETAWSMPPEHWQADHSRRVREAQAARLARDAKRKQDLATHIPSLLDGTAPPGLLYHVAVAYERGFSDIRGDTPLERVRNYLVSDEATAQAVIAALPLVLERDDLPTFDEALALEAKGRQHYIRPAALLAARLVCDNDPDAPLHWSHPLAERLVAYYLTDGTGTMPGWYHSLVRHRPDWVAPVLLRYAQPKLKRRQNTVITGVHALGREADHADLARRVLPELLRAFPLKASEAARRTLNQALLAALPVLHDDQAKQLIRERLLRRDEMDAAQRLCWLVADLPFHAEAASELATLVGHNERRAVILGQALHEQATLSRVVQRLKPDAVQRLIEVLAPITGPEARHRNGIVTDTHYRGDTMHALFSALSSNPDAAARQALLDLARAKGLQAWRTVVQYSLREQTATLRETSFHTASPGEVALALAKLAPANPADLRALVMQHLRDLQDQWRGADTFALKQFWRVPGKTPQVENDCRDLLLERLRERLKPLNIDVGREHSAAQDKRADACATFMRDGHRIALPVEVKKEDHDRLWTAWRDQLQDLYAIDPDAQGYGLYLVLWFGIKVRVHPEGRKLSSAKELRDALTERIPTEDRHRLVVQVLDLSWPTT